MGNDFSKIIATDVDKIPKAIRNAMTSIETGRVIQEIGEMHHLHLDAVANLMEEVGAVMLGMTRPSAFSSKIKNTLELSEKEAESITKEIDEKVFQPIKAALVEMYDHEEEDHSKLSREDILKEIETHVSIPSKPTPTINIAPDHTLVSPLATKELEAPKKTSDPIATPTAQNSTPQVTQKNPPTAPQTLPTANKPEEKTREVSVAPQSKVEISVPKNSPRSESRSTDPYREPIG